MRWNSSINYRAWRAAVLDNVRFSVRMPALSSSALHQSVAAIVLDVTSAVSICTNGSHLAGIKGLVKLDIRSVLPEPYHVTRHSDQLSRLPSAILIA